MQQRKPTILDSEEFPRTPPAARSQGPAYTRLLALFVTLAALAGLVGCGSRATSTGLIYRVNPPGVSVQALRAIDDQGATEVTLRLANHSTVATSFAEVEFQLSLDGMPSIDMRAAPGLTIPALSSDVISVRVNLPPDGRDALGRAETRGNLPYVISGRITTESPDGRHRVEFSSRLNPVPGRPGEFR